MKRIAPILAVLLVICIALASCKTSSHSTRKCDGRKGQRTPMGNI